MPKKNRDPQLRGYVRLSRDDPDAADPLEARFALRVGIIRSLAERRGHTLTDDLIVVEQESAGSIDKRPLFKALLADIEAGKVDYLYTAYQDRILRGDKADEQRVEDAFILGAVTLITTEGETDFGSENYDPLQFEVRALIARYERRGYIKKRRETNRQRTREGIRACGSHPYGYIWVKARYEGKKLIEPGHFRVVPDQYTILEEIYRRIWTESLHTIALSLTERFQQTGSPVPPSHTREMNSPTRIWNTCTLRHILLNPLYAGYPAGGRQKINVKGKRIEIPAEDWILSDEIQSYRHPDPPPGKEDHHWRVTTRDEQLRISETLSQRASRGTAKTVRNYLATGIVYCDQGRQMSGKNGSYVCYCYQILEPHANSSLKAWRVHAALYTLFEQAIQSLPPNLLQSLPVQTDRTKLRKDYQDTDRALRDARENAYDLMANKRRHEANFGAVGYDAACQRNAAETDRLTTRLADLKAQLDTPDIVQVLPLFQRIQETGVAHYWEAWTAEEKRQAIHLVVEKLTVVPVGTCKHVRNLAVTYMPWIRHYAPNLPTTVDLPRRNTDKNSLVL